MHKNTPLVNKRRLSLNSCKKKKKEKQQQCYWIRGTSAGDKRLEGRRGVKHSGRVGARHDPPSHLERVMVKRCHSREERSNDIIKTKFVKSWDRLVRSERTRWKNVNLLKNMQVGANWWRDISAIMLQWLHRNPSKIALDGKVTISGYFRRLCMQSLEWCLYLFTNVH